MLTLAAFAGFGASRTTLLAGLLSINRCGWCPLIRIRRFHPVVVNLTSLGLQDSLSGRRGLAFVDFKIGSCVSLKEVYPVTELGI